MKQIDRATKIVATVGPASRSPEVLSRMIDAGLNVVRMNFSHGDREDHRQTLQMVRELAAKKGVTIGILQDLQGPKIRVGRFAEGSVTLAPGDKFTITMDDVEGDATRVGTTYKALIHDVTPGMALLLDDGNMALRVEGVRGNDVLTTVVIGGVLKNNKGINVPEADLSVPALSEKDVQDMEFGAELGVDWVALSFVRSRDDLLLGPGAWAAGMMINRGGLFGPGPRAYGHCGWGGSYGYADPDLDVTVGYTLNRMNAGVLHDPRGMALAAAVDRFDFETALAVVDRGLDREAASLDPV